jgi:alpha-methylacyl-CoA racemase
MPLDEMQPLDDVRVIDLSRLLPGPMCSWYLRGLGAEVIKVEDPRLGDYLRNIPPLGEDGVGVWFDAINAGCRSVALDLKSDAGRAGLHALLQDADVLLEGFRPGVMDRLGLGPEGLRSRYPRLVVASITGFGQTGPMKHAPGHDLGYCGLAGTLSLGARRDGVPEVPGIQVADLAGGALTAALRITAALLLRARSGRGSHLDVSMTEGVLPFALPALAQAAACGVSPEPGREALTGGLGTYRAYRCADDRLLTVAAIEPKFLAALQAGLGADVPLTAEGLAKAFATRDRDDWLARLGGACVEPVLDPLEILSHPLHRARGAIRGEGRTARVVPPTGGPSAWLHDPAPRLGEHTAAVLAEVGFGLEAEPR